MKFGTDFHVLPRKNYINFSHPLTFNLEPSLGQINNSIDKNIPVKLVTFPSASPILCEKHLLVL